MVFGVAAAMAAASGTLAKRLSAPIAGQRPKPHLSLPAAVPSQTRLHSLTQKTKIHEKIQFSDLQT